MEYISSAGIAWLERHNITVDQMVNRWKQGLPVKPQPSALWWYNHPDDADYSDGGIIYRNGLWRIHQDCGGLRYSELGTGHAKVRIACCQFPETLLITPKRSIELDKIVSAPLKSIAREASGEVIRIVNKSDNSAELLMRIDWHTITSAWWLNRY